MSINCAIEAARLTMVKGSVGHAVIDEETSRTSHHRRSPHLGNEVGEGAAQITCGPHGSTSKAR